MPQASAAAELTFQYKERDGLHCFTSRSVPGLFLVAAELDQALGDLSVATIHIMATNLRKSCPITDQAVWQAFEAAERRARAQGKRSFRFTVPLDGGGGGESRAPQHNAVGIYAEL